MDTRSKPIFFLLGHPLLFDNMLVFPFIRLACFVCPVWLSLLVCFVHALPISFVSFFACLLACFFVFASTCMEHGCLEQERDLLGISKKGKDASPQREMFSRLRGLAPLEWFSPSPFLKSTSLDHVLGFPVSIYPLFSPCFLLGSRSLGMTISAFTFAVPSWAIPLECWQCLFCFSCSM